MFKKKCYELAAFRWRLFPLPYWSCPPVWMETYGQCGLMLHRELPDLVGGISAQLQVKLPRELSHTPTLPIYLDLLLRDGGLVSECLRHMCIPLSICGHHTYIWTCIFLLYNIYQHLLTFSLYREGWLSLSHLYIFYTNARTQRSEQLFIGTLTRNHFCFVFHKNFHALKPHVIFVMW